MLRIALAALLFSTVSATSAELSPWFGSDGQEAFQIAANIVKPAIVSSVAPTSDGPCEDLHCPAPPKLAKELSVAAEAP